MVGNIRIICTILICLFTFSAKAEDPSSFMILEQTVSTPFRPVSAYSIIAEKGSDEKIKIHHYYAMAYNNSEDLDKTTGKRTVSIGSLIPAKEMNHSSKEFYYCFFMASINGEFAVTEVKTETWDNLKNSYLTSEQLVSENKKYEQQIPLQRTRKIILENKLAEAKQQATKMAGIDDLLDLK